MKFVLAFAAVGVFAQSIGGAAFEVASVKPSPPVYPGDRVYFGPARGGPGTSDPGQITWTYARLLDLLMTAYDMKAYQIVGPAWMSAERYDVVAKVPRGATREQVNLMWQDLLAERFGLKAHREAREFQVDELQVGMTGPKLKESADPDPDALGPPQVDKNGGLDRAGLVTTIRMEPGGPKAHVVARAQPLSKLTAMMSQANRPVLDKTGLTGKYDFTIDFRPNLPQAALGGPGLSAPPGDTASDPGPDLATAVQQQLGLRLVKGKATLDVVIVDKVEKVPTGN